MFAWGGNHLGQLGIAEAAYATTPMRWRCPSGCEAVAAGMYYSLALSTAGNVYAWGWNGLGQLGLDDRADRRVPTRVPALSRVRAIAAGQAHAVALAAGHLYGWGGNASGQLGAADASEPARAPCEAAIGPPCEADEATPRDSRRDFLRPVLSPSAAASWCRRCSRAAAATSERSTRVPVETFVDPQVIQASTASSTSRWTCRTSRARSTARR